MNIKVSLGRRLAFILSALTLLGATVLISTGLTHQNKNIFKEMTEGNMALATMLSTQLAGGLRWNNESALRGTYTRFMQQHEQLSNIMIFNTEGKLMTSDEHPEGSSYLELEFLFQSHRDKIHDRTIMLDRESHIVTLSPVYMPRTDKHVGYLAIAWSQREFKNSLEELLVTQFIVLSCIVLVILVLINYFLQRIIIQPLRYISSLMMKMTGSYNITIPNSFLERNDELGSLANSFNEMIFKIKERDLTLKKQKKQAEEAQLKAEEANMAKRDFLANMSHEIRTPMNGIIGTTDLLVGTKLSEQQYDYAATVQRSANALLSIINDILDFTKIEAGELTLEPIPFDLEDLVHDIVNVFHPTSRAKGLSLILRYDPSAPQHVVGDPVRIRQIISNLISNAIKFTEKGYVLVNINHQGQDDFCISVEDTGIGIAKEKQVSIFERFTQADASTTRKYGGTGLGLAISCQLVNMMHGQITLDSREGIGSTFAVTLNLPTDNQDEKHDFRKIENLGSERILIIEKHEKSLEIVKEYLYHYGAKFIRTYTNPHEVIRVLSSEENKKHPYTLAIMGYDLLEMTGETLGKQIRLHPNSKDLKMVVIPSLGAKVDIQNFTNIGFDACITRPIKHSAFHHVLGILSSSDYERKTGFIHTGLRTISEQRLAEQQTLPEDLEILVAEDDPVNQKVIQALLKEIGYASFLAKDGYEALEWLERKSFDLVFMDMQMPGMDGTETTRKIRAREEAEGLDRTPIFALTANAMKEHRDMCIEAGMDDYLSKPVTQAKLRSIIAEWSNKLGPSCEEENPELNGRHQNSVNEPTPALSTDQDPASKKVVNMSTLKSIVGDDLQETKDFLELFVKSAKEVISLMENAEAIQDIEAFKRAAHRLKGSAINFGALEVHELCKEGEEHADKSCHKDFISSVDKALKRVEEFIQNNL